MESLEAPDFELPDLDGRAVPATRRSGSARSSSSPGRRGAAAATTSRPGSSWPRSSRPRVSTSCRSRSTTAPAAAKEWVDAADPRPDVPGARRPRAPAQRALRHHQRAVGRVDRRGRPHRAGAGDRARRRHVQGLHEHRLVGAPRPAAALGARRASCPRTRTRVRARSRSRPRREQLARLERRVGAHLARDGRADAAERHFAARVRARADGLDDPARIAPAPGRGPVRRRRSSTSTRSGRPPGRPGTTSADDGVGRTSP